MIPQHVHARAIPACVAIVFASMLSPACAAVITVGQTGALCDAVSIEDAVAQAARLAGRDEIRVTRDVAGGTWHANLQVMDRDFDLVGGFENCASVEPAGRTALAGVPGTPAPVLTLRGDIGDVGIVRLDLSGGSAGEKNDGAGIEFTGSGMLTLDDTSLAGNASPLADTSRAALAVMGSGGTATLRFKDRVSVADNAISGVRLFGDVHFESLGRDVEIARNQGFGLLVDGQSSIDLGGNGRMFAGNATWGIVVLSAFTAEDSPRTSRLYSIDAADPVRLHANGLGAILMLGNGAGRNAHRLCTRNVSITGHSTSDGMSGRGLVDVDGASVELSMNEDCEFPPEADIACEATACRLIGHNERPRSGALVYVHNGGRVTLDRTAFVGNRASSIAVANAGDPVSASSLRFSNSLVAANTLGTQVIGAYNGASVRAIGLTLADNHGAFAQSLRAVDAGLLEVQDTIVDQTQPLATLEGDPSTAALTRLLVRNAQGAREGDAVLVGAPIYAAGSYRQAPGSPGIDRAPALGGLDADERARDVDTAEIPDGDGPRDLGAYELQLASLDPVFADGFDTVARASRD